MSQALLTRCDEHTQLHDCRKCNLYKAQPEFIAEAGSADRLSRLIVRLCGAHDFGQPADQKEWPVESGRQPSQSH